MSIGRLLEAVEALLKEINTRGEKYDNSQETERVVRECRAQQPNPLMPSQAQNGGVFNKRAIEEEVERLNQLGAFKRCFDEISERIIPVLEVLNNLESVRRFLDDFLQKKKEESRQGGSGVITEINHNQILLLHPRELQAAACEQEGNSALFRIRSYAKRNQDDFEGDAGHHKEEFFHGREGAIALVIGNYSIPETVSGGGRRTFKYSAHKAEAAYYLDGGFFPVQRLSDVQAGKDSYTADDIAVFFMTKIEDFFGPDFFAKEIAPALRGQNLLHRERGLIVPVREQSAVPVP